MRFDIVIPTHNNTATIGRLLEALRLELHTDDRVLVVDDGSTDMTPSIVERACARWKSQCLLLRQSHQGPAAARNRGIESSTADVVLFLGADMMPRSRLLARHRAVHRAWPEDTVGCAGFVTWDPSLPPTPLMIWLEHGGNQNAFGNVAGEEWIDPTTYCYGANLSLKRALLQKVGGFDATHFPSYGWEDLDLGIRLSRLRFRLRYEPTARVWHVHPQTLRSVLKRQRLLGLGVVTLERLHPDVVRLPRGKGERVREFLRQVCFPSFVRGALSFVAERYETRVMLSRVYQRLTALAFTKSVQDARSVPYTVESFPSGFKRV